MPKAVNLIGSLTDVLFHAIGVFAFILLPFVSMTSTQDPELMPRMALMSGLIFLIGLVLLLGKPQFKIKKSSIVALGILLLMMFWAGISMFQSINLGDAFTEWFRLAIHCCFFFCLYIVFSDSIRERINILCRYAMIAVLIFSVFGMFQMITSWEKHNDRGYYIANTIWSTLSNKNFFSECLVLFLPFLIRGVIEDKGFWRVFFRIALLTDIFFILIIQSAAAWLAVLIAVIAFAVLRLRKESITMKRLFPAFMLFALILSIVFFVSRGEKSLLSNKVKSVKEYLLNPELLNKTTVENNNSVFDRIILWRNSFRMIADHPVTGVGLNNWKLINSSYGIGGTQYTDSGMMSYEHPHNDYLLVLAEQGPVGLVIYLLLILFIIRIGLKSLRNAVGRQKDFIVLLICGVIAFSVISFLSYPRSRSYQMILLMTISAVLLSFSGEDKIRTYNIRPAAIILLFISLFGTVIFSKRILAEVHTKNAVIAQLRSNFPRMYREAEKADTWLFPLDITSTPLSWYKGMAMFYMGDVPGAIVEYEKAIKCNPNHLRILNDLATSYEKSGRSGEAISFYRKALKISPYFIEGNLNLSAAYYNIGNIDSAYYFVSKINGLKMSMSEERNHKSFLEAIDAKRTKELGQSSE